MHMMTLHMMTLHVVTKMSLLCRYKNNVALSLTLNGCDTLYMQIAMCGCGT